MIAMRRKFQDALEGCLANRGIEDADELAESICEELEEDGFFEVEDPDFDDD